MRLARGFFPSGNGRRPWRRTFIAMPGKAALPAMAGPCRGPQSHVPLKGGPTRRVSFREAGLKTAMPDAGVSRG